jgi:hypothetical protein
MQSHSKREMTMSLFTRFTKNSNELRSETPISDEELMAFAPSIFKDVAHPSRSAKYTHIPTVDVHRALVAEGFLPYRVAQQKARPKTQTIEAIAEAKERTEFKKHMLLYRHPDAAKDISVRRGGFGEVGIVGSHDGGSSFMAFSAWLEAICFNGLYFGEVGVSINIPHKGDVIGQVLEGAFRVMASLGPVADWRGQMRQIPVSLEARIEFAREALKLRWQEEAPIMVTQLLERHRIADETETLWGTYQVVEENLRRGGQFPYVTAEKQAMEGQRMQNGRARHLRRTGAVNGIDGALKLERGLSDLAETWRKRLAA